MSFSSGSAILVWELDTLLSTDFDFALAGPLASFPETPGCGQRLIKNKVKSRVKSGGQECVRPTRSSHYNLYL